MSHLGINYVIKAVYIWIYPRKMVKKLNGPYKDLLTLKQKWPWVAIFREQLMLSKPTYVFSSKHH